MIAREALAYARRTNRIWGVTVFAGSKAVGPFRTEALIRGENLIGEVGRGSPMLSETLASWSPLSGVGRGLYLMSDTHGPGPARDDRAAGAPGPAGGVGVRPGLAIEAGDGRDSVASLVPQGRGHEENGLELAWLEKSWRPDPPLLAAVASNHRFGGWFAILAEYCSNGRLVLVLDGLAASRFRHERPGWCSLAKRPENHGSQERLAITPHSAQIETLVWLTGCSASDAASRLATSGDSDLTADDPGDFDDEALVGALHAHEGPRPSTPFYAFPASCLTPRVPEWRDA